MVEALYAVVADVAVAGAGRPVDIAGATEFYLEELGFDGEGVAELSVHVHAFVEGNLRELLLQFVLRRPECLTYLMMGSSSPGSAVSRFSSEQTTRKCKHKVIATGKNDPRCKYQEKWSIS